MSYDRERMRRVMGLVNEHVDNARRNVKEFFPGPVLGEAKVDDDTFMLFVEQMIEQYPPQVIQFQDGSTVEGSPWMIALTMVEGGEEILDRIERIQG